MIKIFFSDSLLPDIPKNISEYRLNKINSAVRSKQAMINSARVLKAGFASYGISESEVIYAFGKHGKPFAQNFPKLKFSLSHSKDMAIIAFYDKEIGIDCENSDILLQPGLLQRFFSESEQNAFKQNPLLLWVSKEALVKQSGNGFILGCRDSEIPYYSDKTVVNEKYLQRLPINGFECVLCSDVYDSFEINKI